MRNGLKRYWLIVIGFMVFFLTSQVQAQMRVVSGSYEGNGTDNRSITGVGFQPDVVIIKGDTNTVAVCRTSTMTGDQTKPLVGSNALADNRIQSLDTDGFTIGTHGGVNSNNKDYYWVAFKAAAGEMVVSTYTGNSAGGNNNDNNPFPQRYSGVTFAFSNFLIINIFNCFIIHTTFFQIFFY